MERKTMTPDEDGVLTVEVGGTEHEYSVSEGETVAFEWETR